MSVDVSFVPTELAMVGAQSALVALPGTGVPRALQRLRGRGWALVLPLSIAIAGGAMAASAHTAVALSWLALLAVPPLAAAALGWGMHGARPWAAVLAIPLLIVGWSMRRAAVGELALALLTVLSCVTLGRLLAAIVPRPWLQVAIVATAVIDTALVLGGMLHGSNVALAAAVPASGLPGLQALSLPDGTLGYGDLVVAGALGGALAARGMRQWPVALLVFALSLAWDLMFYVVDVVPATVSVAVAVLIVARDRAARRLRRRSPL